MVPKNIKFMKIANEQISIHREWHWTAYHGIGKEYQKRHYYHWCSMWRHRLISVLFFTFDITAVCIITITNFLGLNTPIIRYLFGQNFFIHEQQYATISSAVETTTLICSSVDGTWYCLAETNILSLLL